MSSTVSENSEITCAFLLNFSRDPLKSSNQTSEKSKDIFGSSDIFIRSHELVAQLPCTQLFDIDFGISLLLEQLVVSVSFLVVSISPEIMKSSVGVVLLFRNFFWYLRRQNVKMKLSIL